MRTHQLAAIVIALTATLAVQMPAPAVEEPPGPEGGLRTVATTDEQDCHEVITTRGVVTSAVDALVPDRYGLATTPAISLAIVTYTCRDLAVDLAVDRGHDSHGGTTMVSIGSVTITSVDGVPTVGATRYALWYGTDDPRLFAAVRSSGMPATFLHGSTADLPPASTPASSNVTISWALRGLDLSYDLGASAVEPAVEPTDSFVAFLHERPDGRTARLTIHTRKLGTATTTSTTAQFAGIDALQPLLTDPRFNTVPQPGLVARFPYHRGSWSSVLTVE